MWRNQNGRKECGMGVGNTVYKGKGGGIYICSEKEKYLKQMKWHEFVILKYM